MAHLVKVDASKQDALTNDQVKAFERDGLLVLRNLLEQQELERLQVETSRLVEIAAEMAPRAEEALLQAGGKIHLATTDRPAESDFAFRRHAESGRAVPYRIEYIIDKSTAARDLVAHPFILNTVQSIQGSEFIPTWDSMVFKLEGAGAIIPWHRDDDSPATHTGGAPIFNVDVYLDPSDGSNCLRAIPGSHHWSSEQATETIERLNDGGGFNTDESVVTAPMSAGDALLHNIHVLHGSPAAQSNLRRVIYFEFRPASVEQAVGPHTNDYIPLKQALLQQCIEARRGQPVRGGHRIPHERYWRASAGGSQG